MFLIPTDEVPRYLLRDRDRIFGHEFVQQVKAMGIEQVLSAPRSPWQQAHIERVIGSIRECLDQMIVFNEGSLRRHLRAYADYYHQTRTHLALQKDSPEPRAVQTPDGDRFFDPTDRWSTSSLRASGCLKSGRREDDPVVSER